MEGLTDYITEGDWEDILIVTFVLVDDAWPTLPQAALARRQRGPAPGMSDSEVVAVALFVESIFDGDEEKGLAFLRQYHPTLFPALLDASRFNRRRRDLWAAMEALRCHFRDAWRKAHPRDADITALRVIDSAPIPICTYTRGSRCQSIPLEERDEWFGVCPSKKTKFFGPRCHATIDLDQMIDSWCLAPGSYHDLRPVPALLEGQQNLSVIGDKAYISSDLDNQVWQDGEHLILALRKVNQKVQWPKGIQAILGKIRHRIEAAFSVLTTAFNLDKLGSRSFSGMVSRATTRVLLYTLSFFLAEILTPHVVARHFAAAA
jgi:hypothetical protein